MSTMINRQAAGIDKQVLILPLLKLLALPAIRAGAAD